jgi:hypothetical protein
VLQIERRHWCLGEVAALVDRGGGSIGGWGSIGRRAAALGMGRHWGRPSPARVEAPPAARLEPTAAALVGDAGRSGKCMREDRVGRRGIRLWREGEKIS